MNDNIKEREIKRYYHILGSYLDMAKQLDCCIVDDKEFYQDVCLLFADKVKSMRNQLTKQGGVICQDIKMSLCEKCNEKK